MGQDEITEGEIGWVRRGQMSKPWGGAHIEDMGSGRETREKD